MMHGQKNIKLTNRPPTKLKEIQITTNLKPNLTNIGKTRRRPQPPNFKRTPAKITEPETGASTVLSSVATRITVSNYYSNAFL
jgi:hypothetical protein